MRARIVVLMLFVLCLAAWAAGDVAVVPRQGVTAAPVSQKAGSSTDAITIPHMMSYQGKLTDSLGRPVPDSAWWVLFALYTEPVGGTPFWTENQQVPTSDGLFHVLLGQQLPIPSVPEIGNLFLGMKVGADPEMTPRVRIVSAAYALLAARADTANYALAGSGGDNAWTRVGSDSVLYTVHNLGIARGGADNTLHGAGSFTHVNLGVASTTGASGHHYSHATVGGGYNNVAAHSDATVGGGSYNEATGSFATVGGGRSNAATLSAATVAGGDGNTATGISATVSGGSYNGATGGYATVGGGDNNDAAGYAGTVGGGNYNTATGISATVSGGNNNDADGYAGTVGGGYYNDADGMYATVGGGNDNDAYASAATIGGGVENTADGDYATVGGGYDNIASGGGAVVAGGAANTASGLYATVCGGPGNTASGSYAAVGGGSFNVADEDYGTVPGGYGDTCSGGYALAAGYGTRIRVGGDYTLAFGENCSTSVPRAVVFYHSGAATKLGVGVQTPTHNIDVQGGAYCSGTNWVNGSSRKLKTDISTLTPEQLQAVLAELERTEVVNYRYRSETSGEQHIGLIAEDAPELLATPERDGINTADAIGWLVAVAKAQQAEIEALRSELRRR